MQINPVISSIYHIFSSILGVVAQNCPFKKSRRYDILSEYIYGSTEVGVSICLTLSIVFIATAFFYGSLTPRWRGDDGFERKSHHERRWRTQSGWLALAVTGNTSPIGRACTHNCVKPVRLVSCLLSSPKDEEFRIASAIPFNGPRGDPPVIREFADSRSLPRQT